VKFAFTDDQLAFRDALRDLLARECPPSVVRDAWANDTGRTKGVWSQLGEMGVLGAMAPEAAGGLGFTEEDVVLLLEETGYAALPEPIVEHVAVAVPMLADPGPALSGGVTITAQCTHQPVAAYAASAERLVMFQDGMFHALERADATLTPRTSVDGSRRLGEVAWDATASTPLGVPDDAGLAFNRGAVATAAQLVGLTRRMLDLTVAYASDRKQFGVPIGSFQAVKHHLADARIALEFARPLVYRAAWSLAHRDPEHEIHVSMAKATAGEAALLAGRKSLQCHGAIGYSYEYDLHLFMKRAWALAACWGDASWHRARVGRAILGPAAAKESS
jgi:alkylation response protein AidB-like acyl-CoA dehydrogenase